MNDEPIKLLVREAVHETLSGLGFDLKEQPELQADMYYLRRMRKGSEDVHKIIRHSLLTLLVSTGLFLLWEAVRGMLGK